MAGLEKIDKSIVILGGSVCTKYGLKVVKSLIEKLAVGGLHIVSGLETKISFLSLDTTLNVGGYASGFFAGNIKLARKIPDVNQIITKLISCKNGSVYMPSRSQNVSRGNPFLSRDKAMIKKCNGVLVIEALIGSRIFNAVEFAIEENKPIYAVPGEIFSYTSKGTNLLIKTGATLIESHKDVLNSFIDFDK